MLPHLTHNLDQAYFEVGLCWLQRNFESLQIFYLNADMVVKVARLSAARGAYLQNATVFEKQVVFS